MQNVKLTLGCGWYDRTEPLAHGWVKPAGIDLRIETVEDPRELFDRLVAQREFDIAEFSSSEHISMTVRGASPFVALPVFTSRAFRHSFICINTEYGIAKPKHLEGRRIGVPLYTMSAAIWCRGLLRDEYGVDLSNVTWVEGAMEKPGLHGTPKEHALAKPAKIVGNKTGKSLSQLLENGEIDATLGALMPTGFGQRPNIARLFPDFRRVEIASYKSTGVHPIMHLLVMRRDLHEREPWIAQSLARAFDEAKRKALARLYFTGAPKSVLPMLHAEVEETRAIFGEDPWPDGVELNKPTLERMLTYMLEDGIITRRPTYDELFVTLDA